MTICRIFFLDYLVFLADLRRTKVPARPMEHDLQRDAAEEVRRNQLPREVRVSGERASVRRRLCHSADAKSSVWC